MTAPQTIALDAALQQAVAHHQAGRLSEAEQLYRAILQVQPNQPDANHNLGVLAGQVGQHAVGLPYLKTALEANPAQGQYVLSYAEALLTVGQAKKALDILQAALLRGFDTPTARALRRKAGVAVQNSTAKDEEPTLAEIDSLVALFNAGCYEELESQSCLLLERRPNTGFAWKALGTALLAQGKEALSALQKTAELVPDDAEAHNNLGAALLDRGRLNDATACYRRALEINPDYAEAHCNLGVALQDLGQFDLALASFRRAREIKPDYVAAHNNLLYAFNLLAGHSAQETLDEARRFDEMATRKARPYASWRNTPDPARRLRVGLVSGDLRNHPVGYFLENVLTAQATDSLEFIAYPSRSNADALTERIKACCHGWHSAVGLSDEGLAQLIRDDGIDILIDLSGHTANNRLPMFAWNPAPIQVSWLGYFATTGLSAMDYLIADPWTLPKSAEVYFTEKIWRLPETRLCFTPPDEDVSVSALPALTQGYLTFGCFNNLTKMTDAVVSLWARVLQAVPGSRLLLKTKQLGETATRQRTHERFAACGISSERLILEGASPRAEYLAAYRRVDIALDPFPYPGGATSAESLWMGVPLLTLAGECFLSRQGVGLLMNAGLSEWIAADADDYVTKAAKYAGELQRLATLRDGLRQQALASPIFDAPRFARHFEAALRDMWLQWCKPMQPG